MSSAYQTSAVHGPVRCVVLTVALLFAAGVGAGLCGSIAGLASLVSFPALLGAGLNPVTANVTNTAALLTTTVGSIAGSRPELSGRWRALAPLALRASAGGVLGAMLVLTTPVFLFERVVPVFVAIGATVVLAAPILRRASATDNAGPGARTLSNVAVTGAGVYGGYFAAGAGVLMMAVLSLRVTAPLTVVNAAKNVCSGAANMTASVIYVVAAPIDYSAALPLGVGALLGSWLGPLVMRRLPEAPLRWVIGLGGYALALYLL